MQAQRFGELPGNKNGQIVHRRIVAGWEILRNHGRNNNSPGTGYKVPEVALSDLSLPRKVKAKPRCYSAAEMARIVSSADEPLGTICFVLSSTGMRSRLRTWTIQAPAAERKAACIRYCLHNSEATMNRYSPGRGGSQALRSKSGKGRWSARPMNTLYSVPSGYILDSSIRHSASGMVWVYSVRRSGCQNRNPGKK
jgi:hypothetical protein